MIVRSKLLVVSASLAIGVALGLLVSDKPFVLEATNTPIGSFVLKYTPVYNAPMPSPLPFEEQLLDNHIA